MTVLPSPTEQVRYEAGTRPKYAAIAFVAGLLLVASLLIEELGPHVSVSEETIQLLNYHKRFPLDIVGSVIDAIALLALAAMLNWLYRITVARDPKQSPFPRVLALIGAPLVGVMEIVTIIIFSIKANSFATGGNQGYPEAYNLLHPVSTILGISGELLQPLGALLLAAGFIWTSINAMRVGLLPRPMGWAGVLAGALFVFAIGPVSYVVQGVWLVLAAILIAGRWPNGTPPAWEEGIAIPWLPGGVPNREAAGQAEGEAAQTRKAPQQDPNYAPRRKKKKR